MCPRRGVRFQHGLMAAAASTVLTGPSIRKTYWTIDDRKTATRPNIGSPAETIRTVVIDAPPNKAGLGGAGPLYLRDRETEFHPPLEKAGWYITIRCIVPLLLILIHLAESQICSYRFTVVVCPGDSQTLCPSNRLQFPQFQTTSLDHYILP